MKNLLVLLLALCAFTLQADSGLYYDKDRGGEGLSLHQNGDTIAAFLFTYGGTDVETPVPVPPYVSPQAPLAEPLNGQRWFLISGDTLVNDTYVTGIIYSTGGINYPERLSPNGIGAAIAVGEYLLDRSGAGWSLTVLRLENSPLAEDDPLFLVPFNFDTLLFQDD